MRGANNNEGEQTMMKGQTVMRGVHIIMNEDKRKK